MIRLPIDTPRLQIRMMRSRDADALAAYRNLDEIARYQDWVMPYTVGDAEKMLRDQDDLDGPEAGAWVQLAIEHQGVMIGDLALGLIAGGHIGSLGYTLAPEHHGHGFAGEAAGALIDALFASGDVHRVIASLDPENHASMRMLEQLGFLYEGLARQAEPIRGEWLDDMRFGLLAEDRAAWLARPTSCEHVELVEVTHQNLREVSALQTHRFQRRFVAPMERNLAQALVPEIVKDGVAAVPWYRAVVADGEVVGFVMYSDVSPVEPYPFLWRFLIDRMHQRRGVGTRAIEAVIEHVRSEGHRALGVSWVDAPGGPRPFYERLGFVPTGELDGDEIVARLDL
jgi:RimJ/RimL family protein N-acetyltransferase